MRIFFNSTVDMKSFARLDAQEDSVKVFAKIYGLLVVLLGHAITGSDVDAISPAGCSCLVSVRFSSSAGQEQDCETRLLMMHNSKILASCNLPFHGPCLCDERQNTMEKDEMISSDRGLGGNPRDGLASSSPPLNFWIGVCIS
jgi:hypothetical protein